MYRAALARAVRWKCHPSGNPMMYVPSSWRARRRRRVYRGLATCRRGYEQRQSVVHPAGSSPVTPARWWSPTAARRRHLGAAETPPPVSTKQRRWITVCGRYASARSRIELLEEFDVQRDRVDESLKPDYNVAPTKPVYAVMTRTPRADRQLRSPDDRPASGRRDNGSGPARELRVVRWGLVPSWAKDISIGSRMINARAETVSEKPAFRKAFASRRCLLPADGYYEWQPPPAGAKGPKQPYFICRPDH